MSLHSNKCQIGDKRKCQDVMVVGREVVRQDQEMEEDKVEVEQEVKE